MSSAFTWAAKAIGTLFGGTSAANAIGAGLAGLGASQIVKSVMPSAPSMPQASSVGVPTMEKEGGAVAAEAQKRAAMSKAKTKSIYTSPLGVTGKAVTRGKELLG